MPELPEVEVTRRSFADRIQGARVVAVQMGKPLRWPLGIDPQALVGLTVEAVDRRGKYLLIVLNRGLLLLHLGMSGSVQFAAQLPPRGVHDHFELVTTQGSLRLNDPRRFGAVVYADSIDAPVVGKLLGKLGVEPLSEAFEPLSFYKALHQRRGPIKQVVLGGDIVVGVGNIYASESLFLAGIRPTTPAAKVSKARAARLHQAIREVLDKALNSGGSTLRNFSNAHGQSGHFQLEVMVYGREGEPCRVCCHPIRMIRQGQRSTFFCPVCQK